MALVSNSMLSGNLKEHVISTEGNYDLSRPARSRFAGISIRQANSKNSEAPKVRNPKPGTLYGG